MSQTLVPRSTTSVVRTGSREVRALQRQTRYALVREEAEAAVRDERIRNAFELANHVVGRMALLDRTITELTHDNPGLEVTLRLIERSVGFDAAELISGYLRR